MTERTPAGTVLPLTKTSGQVGQKLGIQVLEEVFGVNKSYENIANPRFCDRLFGRRERDSNYY